MNRIIYEQGKSKRVEVEGTNPDAMDKDIFKGVHLYFGDYSLGDYESSHDVQWRNPRTSRAPDELINYSDHEAYVEENGIPKFSDKADSFYIKGSPDEGRRILLLFGESRINADIVGCEEFDGETASFKDFLINGKYSKSYNNYSHSLGCRNPFKIRRLENLKMVSENYVCEIDSNGFLFGSDVKSLLEKGIAREGKYSLVSLRDKYKDKIIKEIENGRKNPRYAEFNGVKRSELTRDFYREMNRKLDNIFRGERK